MSIGADDTWAQTEGLSVTAADMGRSFCDQEAWVLVTMALEKVTHDGSDINANHFVDPDLRLSFNQPYKSRASISQLATGALSGFDVHHNQESNHTSPPAYITFRRDSRRKGPGKRALPPGADQSPQRRQRTTDPPDQLVLQATQALENMSIVAPSPIPGHAHSHPRPPGRAQGNISNIHSGRGQYPSGPAPPAPN